MIYFHLSITGFDMLTLIKVRRVNQLICGVGISLVVEIPQEVVDPARRIHLWQSKSTRENVLEFLCEGSLVTQRVHEHLHDKCRLIFDAKLSILLNSCLDDGRHLSDMFV